MSITIDWIKMRPALLNDPKVIQMATELDLDKFAVAGRLFAVWSWANQYSENGHGLTVTEAFLNALAERSDFTAAMRRAGWLEGVDGALSMPNYEQHNGQLARQKAVTAKRQRRHRSESNAHSNGSTVTENERKASIEIEIEIEKEEDKIRKEIAGGGSSTRLAKKPATVREEPPPALDHLKAEAEPIQNPAAAGPFREAERLVGEISTLRTARGLSPIIGHATSGHLQRTLRAPGITVKMVEDVIAYYFAQYDAEHDNPDYLVSYLKPSNMFFDERLTETVDNATRWAADPDGWQWKAKTDAAEGDIPADYWETTEAPR